MTVFVRHPVDNPVISQPFGAENDWEDPPWHKGIDYKAAMGTPIYAPCDGFVVWASGQPFGYGNTWEMIPGNPNSGNCVIIQPPAPHTALQTSFSHMSGITVSAGQWVTAGTLIGYVGNTGFSFGAHLHWEAFIDYAEGVYPADTFYGRVNPLDYFSTATVVPLGTGGKGSPNIQEEDDMPSVAEIWAYEIAAPSDRKRKHAAHEWLSEANEKAGRAEAKAEAAIAAVKGLLEVRVPDPDNPERTYALKEWITRANIKAGAAAEAAGAIASEMKDGTK